MSIIPDTDPTIPVDWQYLRQQGLAYLQQISQPLWTDFDLHDPGLTLFETLCYGISQLQQHSEQDIETLLAMRLPEQLSSTSEVPQPMFDPEAILTTAPLTTLDMRKLLMDVDGVRNAWVKPARQARAGIYLDRDNRRRSMIPRQHSELLPFKGLHRVLIEPQPDSQLPPVDLVSQVKAHWHQARNLAEDIVSIEIMASQPLYLFAQIELNEQADAEQVLAQLYFDLKQQIEPSVPRYSLAQLLAAGMNMADIYSGPILSKGFIVDSDLAAAEQPEELRLSDLNPVIMAVEGVAHMPYLSASAELAPAREQQYEWVMPLDSSRVLRLAPLADQPITFTKQGQAVTLDLMAVEQQFKHLTEQAQQAAKLAALPAAPQQDLTPIVLPTQQSLALQLPQIYGVSELGLPAEASKTELAQALQLKAFILMFDQLLANAMAHLSSINQHFCVNQTDSQASYLYQRLDDSQDSGFSELADSDWLASIQANPAADIERRNRLLNHLLARFNESFVDRLLLGFRQQQYLSAKTRYLQQQDKLTRERCRAINLLTLPETPQASALNNHGLMAMLAARLDLSEQEQQQLLFVEHILLRPLRGQQNLPLASAYFEQQGDDVYAEPYSFAISCFISASQGRWLNHNGFVETFKQQLNQYLPAHIRCQVKLVDDDKLKQLRQAYLQLLQLSYQSHQLSVPHLPLYQARQKLLGLMQLAELKGPLLHHQGPVETVNYLPKVADWSCFAVVGLSSQSTGASTTVLTISGDEDFPSLCVDLEQDELILIVDEQPQFAVAVDSSGPHLLALVLAPASEGPLRMVQLHLDGVVHGPEVPLYIGRDDSPDTLQFGEANVFEWALLNYGAKKDYLRQISSEFMRKWSLVESVAYLVDSPNGHLDSAKEGYFTLAPQSQVEHWRSPMNHLPSAEPDSDLPLPTLAYQTVGAQAAIAMQQQRWLLANPALTAAAGTLLLVVEVHESGFLFDCRDGEQGFALAVSGENLLIYRGQSSVSCRLHTPQRMFIMLNQDGIDGEIEVSINDQYYYRFNSEPISLWNSEVSHWALGGPLSDQPQQGFSGLLFEWLFYPTALSIGKRQRLALYLMDKWQLDITGVDGLVKPLLQLDASQINSLKLDTNQRVSGWCDKRLNPDDAKQTQAMLWAKVDDLQVQTLPQLSAGGVQFAAGQPLVIESLGEKDITVMVHFDAQTTGATSNDLWHRGAAVIGVDCFGQYNDFGISTGSEGSLLAGIGHRYDQSTTLAINEPLQARPRTAAWSRRFDDGECRLTLAEPDSDDKVVVGQLADLVILTETRRLLLGALPHGGVGFNGRIYEVLVFDQILTAEQITAVSDHLHYKWQLLQQNYHD